MKDKTVRFITFTAMGIALVILAQLLGNVLPAGFTVGGPFTGKQLLTGSLVNCVLFVFTGAVGLWSGVIIGLLSSILAHFFGIGPILPVVPVVACGNALLCLVFGLLRGKLPDWLNVVIAAVLKCGFLWLLVPLVVRAVGVPDKQVAALSVMFSWPQAITALIGGILAILILPRLKKAKNQ